MEEFRTDICPLMRTSSCIKKHCEFWDFGEDQCVIHTIVDGLNEFRTGRGCNCDTSGKSSGNAQKT